MLKEQIFSIKSKSDFEDLTMKIFQFQYINNPIYQRFCNLLGKSKNSVNSINEIPFLPIEFFKKETVLSHQKIEKTFTSSGTTGSVTSKHFVSDVKLYEKSFNEGFKNFYGEITEYIIIALLPSYLEREGSSLVYMADKLIQQSKSNDSGFYLNEIESLTSVLRRLIDQPKKVLLLGVSFALLDLADAMGFNLPDNFIIMETGGMKGRRKEMIRSELHSVLKKKFGVQQIHSEYGMTELLSQAYSKGDGLFSCPPWMDIMIRDSEDPLKIMTSGKTGGINVIDLANINSCSFIATQDLGKIIGPNQFEILGRFDHSDIRGCNLMVI